MPTDKLKAVGIGGVLAIIAMNVTGQIWPDLIDFTQELMGVPLNVAITFAASWIAGWVIPEKHPAPPKTPVPNPEG